MGTFSNILMKSVKELSVFRALAITRLTQVVISKLENISSSLMVIIIYLFEIFTISCFIVKKPSPSEDKPVALIRGHFSSEILFVSLNGIPRDLILCVFSMNFAIFSNCKISASLFSALVRKKNSKFIFLILEVSS